MRVCCSSALPIWLSHILNKKRKSLLIHTNPICSCFHLVERARKNFFMQLLRHGASAVHNLEQVQAMIVAITAQMQEFVACCLGPHGQIKLVKNSNDNSLLLCSDGVTILQVKQFQIFLFFQSNYKQHIQFLVLLHACVSNNMRHVVMVPRASFYYWDI